MAIFLGKAGVNEMLFGALSAAIPYEHLASLAYATIYMLLNWAIGYALWRHRIIIKL